MGGGIEYTVGGIQNPLLGSSVKFLIAHPGSKFLPGGIGGSGVHGEIHPDIGSGGGGAENLVICPGGFP